MSKRIEQCFGTMVCEGHLGGFFDKGDPKTYCPSVWDWFIHQGVRTVLDVGCGVGFACEHFNNNSVHSIGIDGSDTAEKLFRLPGHFVKHDYTKNPLALKAELAWSCEFVEHIEEKYVPNFMKTFSMCNIVAMTYAGPGQGGHHHVNCQPEDYWINVFSLYGFIFDKYLTIFLKNLESNTHFSERGLVFRKNL